MQTITSVMDDDHKRIQRLLDQFLEEQTLENYKKFLWHLERHMITEERAVFSTDVKDPEIREQFSRVLDEHEKLLKDAKLIDISVAEDIARFKKALEHHKYYEDNTLYPRLDQFLDESETKKITEKVSSMIAER